MNRLILLGLCFLIYSCAVNVESSDKESTKWLYHYELGMSSFLLKNYSEAIAHFNRSVQLKSSDPKLWNALGVAYTEVQEYEKAEDAFLKAIEIDKKFSETYLNRGIMYYKRKDYIRAEENLEIAINDEFFEKKHIAYYYLAKVYQQVGNSQMYAHNLVKASLYNPNFLDPQIELAKLYESEKEYDKASSIYLKLIQQNPHIDPQLKLDAARSLWLSGNATLSKSVLADLLKERKLDAGTYGEAKALLDQILINEHKLKYGLLQKKVETQVDTKHHQQELTQRESKNTQKEEKPSGPDIKEAKQSKQDQQSKESSVNLDEKPVNPSQRTVFYIQLAVFSVKEDANTFKSRLEEVTTLRNVTIAEKDSFYRVMLGPYSSRAEVEKDLNEIRRLNIEGVLVTE